MTMHLLIRALQPGCGLFIGVQVLFGTDE